jgi:hypothetical protein
MEKSYLPLSAFITESSSGEAEFSAWLDILERNVRGDKESSSKATQ